MSLAFDYAGLARKRRLVRGDTLDETFEVDTSDGDDADLTGFTVHGAVYDPHRERVLGGTFTIEGAAVRMQLSATESASLPDFVRFQIELRSDTVTRTIVRGDIEVLPDYVI